ncbi:MAG: NAD(P)/FAD-dependent oxidoreductase [Acidobacteria bacterium]|nr:NAD(P)/FAD-dependent oxidoreductase [Acidobacteriota bacterium]
MIDVLVIGGGPAGVVAALRAADLGAKTVLVTRDGFGGMAANDGPVPVRTLAHAARLMRDARQLGRYGIVVGEPQLDYTQLLARVQEVVSDVRAHSTFREQIDSLGVVVNEECGAARFADQHTVETESGLRLRADKIVICTGGTSRKLSVPGSELTATHSDAWGLSSVPPSMIVIGGGATGVQVASIFNALGSGIQLFHAGQRILPTEDEEVSAAVAEALRESGIVVREDFGCIESFEQTSSGVRMFLTKEGRRESVEAALAVTTIGWVANTGGLQLAQAGIETDARGFIRVDEFLNTSAPHVFAAGDVIGRLMLVPQAIQEGFVAATNAVRGATMKSLDEVAPIGSFTDPEYAQVGMTEAQARANREVVVATIRFDSTTRTIIDGRTNGFCKLIADRRTRQILGCHVVGERAVEITQAAAIAISARMRVDELAQVPLSFPTYVGVLGRVAAKATRRLNLNLDWQASQLEDS